MRLFAGVLLFFIICFKVDGQTAVNQYFRPFVLPQSWFESVNADRFYYDYLESVNNSQTPARLRESIIPFYGYDFYIDANVLQVNVASGLIDGKLNNRLINDYALNYSTTHYRNFMPHALPVIYKKSPLPDITSVLQLRKSPFEEYQNFINHPGRGDSLQALFVADSVMIENRKRSFFYDNPQFVQYDYHEIPDPPRVFRSAEGIAARASRESIERIFKAEGVSRPNQLEKVDLVVSPWKFSGAEHVQFSQAYLRNWVRGGQNSTSLLSDLRFQATFTDETTEWENRLVHKIGVLSMEESKSRVNDDLFEISSKYGIKASKKWFYSLLFTGRTQFFKGYANNDKEKENPISSFMSPGYFSLAAGMDYKTKNFTLLLSPLTSRLTVVIDTANINQTRYNIPEDKKSVFLTGGSLQNNFTWNITKEIKLTSAMNIFYDYFEKDERIQAEWDTILDMRINVFLSARIVNNFKYFETESKKIQVRESLSIAFRYLF